MEQKEGEVYKFDQKHYEISRNFRDYRSKSTAVKRHSTDREALPGGRLKLPTHKNTHFPNPYDISMVSSHLFWALFWECEVEDEID